MISPQNKNALLFSFAVAVTGMTSLVMSTAEADTRHMKMEDADIYIPVKQYKQLNDNRLHIEISDKNISRIKFFFARTASFSSDGFHGDRECPFVKFSDKDYSIEKTGKHDFVITAKIDTSAGKLIQEAGCVITPRPPLSKLPTS